MIIKCTYSLDATDYLTYYLFISSITPSSKRRRKKNWIMLTLALLLLAIISEMASETLLRNYFLITTLTTALFFPLYVKWRYKKHYQKQVKEVFAESFGKPMTIQLLDNHIMVTDDLDSMSKISHAQVKSINELPQHVIIRFSKGQSLIIPIKKVNDLTQFKDDLVTLSEKLKLEINNYHQWKW